ncbi:MAG: hypothetical protein M1450_02635 [Patescibacteria group bacterium]|nr:hypothetical protein [Patescibacteria group bacterium]
MKSYSLFFIIFFTGVTFFSLYSLPAFSQSATTSGTLQTKVTIEKSFTFSISGLKNNESVNLGNSGCTNSEKTNSGYDALSSKIDFGNLTFSKINISAQTIRITRNEPGGYTLSATSSGYLRNAKKSFEIPSSVSPAIITTGSAFFGIHPCGKDIDSKIWGSGNTGVKNGAKYAWPYKTSLVLSKNQGTGLIGEGQEGIISIEYGSTISKDTPSGSYAASIIFTALPNF